MLEEKQLLRIYLAYVFCVLLLSRRMVTWNLFVLYKKRNKLRHKKLFFLFQNLSPSFAHFGKQEKIHLTYSVVYTLLVEWKLTTKAELNQETLNLVPRVPSQFLSSEQPCEPKTLPWSLREFKNTLGKVADAVNTGGLLIQILTEWRASDGGNFCPLWLVFHKSIQYSVGDTLQVWAVTSLKETVTPDAQLSRLLDGK